MVCPESPTESNPLAEGQTYAGQPVGVNLYQAWLKWTPNEMVRVKAGIFDTSFFGYTNLYEAHPETLKGAMLKFKTDYAHVSALLSKQYDFGTVPSTTVEEQDAEINYYGLNVKLAQLPEFLNKIKLSYYLQQGDDLAATILPDEARQIHMFGGMVKGGSYGLKLKGKYFRQQGEK